ncbi:MAG: tetratricopeptide repeat protein [Bacteroidales bacterium]|nr:tetratricopeptide repeat protein [Bacteroidales bacterium]
MLIENPEVVEINYFLALLLAETGRYDESRRFFLKAAELIPQQPRIFYNLGLLENSLGNKSEAEGYLLKALSRDPDNFDFMYALATFYIDQKQNSKALPFARQLAEKYPENQAGKQLMEVAGR